MIEFLFFIGFILFLFFVEHHEKKQVVLRTINLIDPLWEMWHQKKCLEQELYVYHLRYGTTVLHREDIYRLLNLTPSNNSEDAVLKSEEPS